MSRSRTMLKLSIVTAAAALFCRQAVGCVDLTFYPVKEVPTDDPCATADSDAGCDDATPADAGTD